MRDEMLEAFGARGQPTPLTGGEGVAVRVDHLVLKPVIDVAETEWTQALLQRVEPDGFRIAEPVAAADGRWVYDGWSACHYVPGLRPAVPSWTTIADAGLRFGAAVDRVRGDDAGPLDARIHRWAIADRVAWDEERVELTPDAAELLDRLTTRRDEPDPHRQFVHGDLSGNVFLDGDGTPVILDVSPYLRPRRWAAAIVVADAVLWHDEPLDLIGDLVHDDADRDLFVRALVFRLVAEQLVPDPTRRPRVQPYRRVLAAL
jgi:uncharacterized protein (TIGR02569 family)